MGNFSDSVIEKIKRHILYYITPPENRDLCGIIWKNISQPARPQMRIGRMRFACWIPMTTITTQNM